MSAKPKFEQRSTRPLPPPLFKYFSLTTEERFEWLEAIIVGRQIRLSRSSDFNDPFDCVPEFIAPKTRVAWRIKGQKWIRRLRTTFGEHVAGDTWSAYRQRSSSDLAELLESASKAARELVGICCLTEVNDSVLMWSHYADSHRGVCLCFELNQFPISDLHLVQKVAYQDDRLSIAALGVEPGEEGVLDKYLIKAKFWEYEREWRTLIDCGAHKIVEFPSNALVGIIFGARCPDKHRARVREMASRSSSKIRFWGANISRSKFELEILAAL